MMSDLTSSLHRVIYTSLCPYSRSTTDRTTDMNEDGWHIWMSSRCTKIKPKYLGYKCFHLEMVASFEIKFWAAKAWPQVLNREKTSVVNDEVSAHFYSIIAVVYDKNEEERLMTKSAAHHKGPNEIFGLHFFLYRVLGGTFNDGFSPL